MVDIETMSVHNSEALILSVGAVEFETSSELGPTFTSEHVWVLDPVEQLLSGRRVDRGTQQFWSAQPESARAHLRGGTRIGIQKFRSDFAAVVDDVEELWANGVVFDIANLASLWLENPPWRYNAVRDLRTVLRIPLLQALPGRNAALESATSQLVAHDPLSDCVMQVWKLWERGL